MIFYKMHFADGCKYRLVSGRAVLFFHFSCNLPLPLSLLSPQLSESWVHQVQRWLGEVKRGQWSVVGLWTSCSVYYEAFVCSSSGLCTVELLTVVVTKASVWTQDVSSGPIQCCVALTMSEPLLHLNSLRLGCTCCGSQEQNMTWAVSQPREGLRPSECALEGRLCRNVQGHSKCAPLLAVGKCASRVHLEHFGIPECFPFSYSRLFF